MVTKGNSRQTLSQSGTESGWLDIPRDVQDDEVYKEESLRMRGGTFFFKSSYSRPRIGLV